MNQDTAKLINNIYSRMWSDSDSDESLAQGWGVAFCSGASHGYDFEIQRIDEPFDSETRPRFDSDIEACQFVLKEAETGKDTVGHKAILLLNELSKTEAKILMPTCSIELG